ncbi:MAG: T9SS type A sorting domain-containing protein, partial [Bacteroidales bacterium]
NFTGVQTNLMEEPYTFVYDAGQSDRFTIYFTVVGTHENPMDNIRVYSFDQTVRVIIPMEMNAHVEVVNMLGQKVMATDAHLGTRDIQINQRGYFLVNITGENQCISKKVFIQ